LIFQAAAQIKLRLRYPRRGQLSRSFIIEGETQAPVAQLDSASGYGDEPAEEENPNKNEEDEEDEWFMHP